MANRRRRATAKAWSAGQDALVVAAACRRRWPRAAGRQRAGNRIPGLPDPGAGDDLGVAGRPASRRRPRHAERGFGGDGSCPAAWRRAECAPHGWLPPRRAGPVAAAWAAPALMLIVLTVSDVLGVPANRLGAASLVSFATSISQGQALLLQAGLALTAAVLARRAVAARVRRRTSPSVTGLVAWFAQLGYPTGLVFVVSLAGLPAADRRPAGAERRRARRAAARGARSAPGSSAPAAVVGAATAAVPLTVRLLRGQGSFWGCSATLAPLAVPGTCAAWPRGDGEQEIDFLHTYAETCRGGSP